MKNLLKLSAVMVSISIILNMWVFANIAKANSIDVAGADIRMLLTTIAAENNLNVIIDDSVSGNISLKLANVPADKMLEVIAQSAGCSFERRDNIIYISRDSRQKTLQSLQVKYLDLTNTAKVINLLLTKGQKLTQESIDKTSKDTKISTSEDLSNIIIDKSDNTLTFYATNNEFMRVKNFLAKMDRPPRQVSLEAKVTAIQKDAEKNLGISWEWSKFPQSPKHDITYEAVKQTIKNEDGTVQEVTNYLPVDEVTRDFNGSEYVPGVIRFGRGADGFPYEFYYAAQLNALISDGKANILARPNITTIQGHEAVINIGSEVPVPTISTTDSTTTTSIEYREAGIILRCIPRINEDGYITVDVHTEVSSPLYVEDMKAYRFQKRSADTFVRLKDGQTMVIGGLIGSDEARQMSKIPFLGDIPILGNLFKHVRKAKSDTEVMIFLTAKEVY